MNNWHWVSTLGADNAAGVWKCFSSEPLPPRTHTCSLLPPLRCSQSEVNRLEWSKKRLAELLPGVAAPPAEGTAVRVTSVKSVTGEVGGTGGCHCSG